MPDCPYCERTFDLETEAREHLWLDHDREELSRIDTRRVEEYIRAHDLEDDAEGGLDDLADPADADFQAVYEHVREKFAPMDPDRAMEPAEVRNLSTDAIVDRLAEVGVRAAKGRFRRRAEARESVSGVLASWQEDYHVTATGYDLDFVWQAAVVLWDRWAGDLPTAHRVPELVMESRDLENRGEDVRSYERLLAAGEELAEATDPDAASLEEANELWEGPLDVLQIALNVAAAPEGSPIGDSELSERRLAFCNEMFGRFPASHREIRREFRFGAAESLFALGRPDIADAVFEELIEEEPTDAWVYAEWGDCYLKGFPAAGIAADPDRADDIYFRGQEAGAEPGNALLARLERPARGSLEF